VADAVDTAVLRAEGLSKIYGGLVANADVDFEAAAGEIHAVIGPNGAGKTTFIKQLAGEMRPTRGRIWLGGRDVTHLPAHRRAALGLARSFQITSVFPSFTARGNVEFACQAAAGHGFALWSGRRARLAMQERAAWALDLVGLTARADESAVIMSHGEHRQLEIAMALVSDPQVMLLDEPTAGMGREESMAFVALVRRVRASRTIVLVEHDMDVVFGLADRITVLAQGRVIACDRPEAIKASAAVRDAYLGQEEAA
jgi:branched-chain amino acid transport system ATP-binding protein